MACPACAGLAPARRALAVRLVQRVANALWPWLFIGWRRGGPAFVEVLLLPYLAWVSFASALAWAVDVYKRQGTSEVQKILIGRALAAG